MTPKKFALVLILQWIIFALLKAWFFNSQIFGNAGLQQLVFWGLTVVIAAALIRRFEYISFVEAFFAVVVWTVFDLILDLIILSPHTGLSIFSGKEYWWGLFFMDAAVMVFHKKRHIKVRHELSHHH